MHGQFQHMVCCEYFNVSKVVGCRCFLAFKFGGNTLALGHFFHELGNILFNFLVTLILTNKRYMFWPNVCRLNGIRPKDLQPL